MVLMGCGASAFTVGCLHVIYFSYCCANYHCCYCIIIIIVIIFLIILLTL